MTTTEVEILERNLLIVSLFIESDLNVATAKRSFSKLKYTKDYLFNSMNQV